MVCIAYCSMPALRAMVLVVWQDSGNEEGITFWKITSAQSKWYRGTSIFHANNTSQNVKLENICEKLQSGNKLYFETSLFPLLSPWDLFPMYLCYHFLPTGGDLHHWWWSCTRRKKKTQKMLFLPHRTRWCLREAQDPHEVANSVTLFSEEHFCYSLVEKYVQRGTCNLQVLPQEAWFHKLFIFLNIIIIF